MGGLAKVDWKKASVVAALGASTIIVLRAQESAGPQFASTVELIALHVTVTDQSRQCLTGSPPYWTNAWDGCPLTDLPREAFRITEDGVPQTVTLFNEGGLPISISLVIDVRSSARVRMRDVHNAAIGMVERLGARDMAALIGFENGFEINQGMTASHSDLDRAIRRTTLNASPSSPNLLSKVLREGSPAFVTGTVRRHAIVLLTDARASFDPGLLMLARRSGAAVYVIGFTGDEILEESGEPAASLRRLASLTGGRAFFPADGRRLSSAFRQIYEELSRQYAIGYTSTQSDRDGGWRHVMVEVNRPDTSARTRQGYFAPDK